MITKKVTIDVAGETKPFRHFFRASGYANADYTYTPPVRKMYDSLASYPSHPVYMRLHNFLTLHGKGDYYITQCGQDYGNPAGNTYHVTTDIVVKKNADGSLAYNWEPVNEVFDIIVNHGMKPIVEAVYMPHQIALSDEKHYLPESFPVWAEVITAFVKHWVSRYGLEEVRTWYFEIFNEPDNIAAWVENPASFFALYDYFEKAVHAVDRQFKVGGPAVKQWEEGKKIFRAFLDHCDHGVNYCTGGYGTRLDFITVHCKGGMPDSNSPSMDYMFTPLLEYVAIIKQYPKFAQTEFINGESDIVWDGNRGISYKSWLNFRNTNYAPGFICKMIHTYCLVIEDEHEMNLTIVDNDNCHLPWEKSLFSGNRSQFTPLGPAPCADLIRKPLFNAFHLLGKLGTARYMYKNDDAEYGKKYGVLATKDGADYAVMVWNFEDGLASDVNDRLVQLTLQNLEKGCTYDVLHYRIDGAHSNAFTVWKELGKPFPLSAADINALRKKDGLELFEAPRQFVSSGVITIDCPLPMHSVSLYELIKRGPVEPSQSSVKLPAVTVQVEQSVLNQEQVFLTWPWATARSCIGYSVYRKDNNSTFKKLNLDYAVTCSYFTDSTVKKGNSYTYVYSFIYADGSESAHSAELTIQV